jgi:hypothetical protein
MTQLETTLRAFFERYARTFHEDVERFCALYDFPSETVRLDGSVQRFDTRAAAVQFFAGARKKFEEEGCARWGIRGLVAEEVGEGYAATIDWDMLTADGRPIRGWRQTYEVAGGGTDWKVRRARLHAGSEVAYPAAASSTLPPATSYRVDFESIAWVSPMPGVRHKVYRVENRLLRLVEYSRDMAPHWCPKGHIGHIVEGCLVLEFKTGTEQLGPGDAVFIPPGPEHAHRAIPVTSVVTALFVEEAVASDSSP